MNGVYVRMNPPRQIFPTSVLYYKHEETNWRIVFNQLPEAEEKEDDEDDVYRFLRRHKKRAEHEWLFVDELGVERFIHGEALSMMILFVIKRFVN